MDFKKNVVLKNKKDTDELNMSPSYLLLFGSDVMQPMILPQNVISGFIAYIVFNNYLFAHHSRNDNVIKTVQ